MRAAVPNLYWTMANQMSLWMKLLLIGLAGAGGALARYGVNQACAVVLQRWTQEGWVWGTLIANVVGCLLFGLVWSWTEGRWPGAVEVRYIVLVGFLGSFTTFSTFAFEAVGFGLTQRPYWVALHVLAHVGLGIAAVGLGLWAGRQWLIT